MSEIVKYEMKSEAIEKVLVSGDLSKLTSQERVNYYMSTCESLGLNPLTKPFDYIQLNGKLVLYPKRDCTDQLRKNNGISVYKLEHETINGVYVVTACGRDTTGREDSSTGAVEVENLRGDKLANAMMKAETKAKRRLTLSLSGLGFVDETEIETIKGAVKVDVSEDGDIIDAEVSTTQTTEMTLERALEYVINKIPLKDWSNEDLEKLSIQRDFMKGDTQKAFDLVHGNMTEEEVPF